MHIIQVASEQFGPAALNALSGVLRAHEQPVVGLPSGQTPVALYEQMRKRSFEFPGGTKLFAVDEYCCPQPQEGTNASYFARQLPGVEIAIPRCDASDPVNEVTLFCGRLDSLGGFDVVVLGIGEDGHIAFNEPPSDADAPCRVVRLAESTRARLTTWKPAPTHGMTVGMDHLLAARRVILLANGKGKAEILAAALRGPKIPGVPASLLQNHSALTVVCDADAGRHLR